MPVREFFVAGGLLRNAVIMQIYADVLRRPLHLIDSEQGPALGAAMHAAVAAGAYADIHAAAGGDGQGPPRRVRARRERAADAYDELYAHYSALHDHFGRGGDDVMHALRGICGAGSRPVADAVAELRRRVCALHAELPRNGLVAWTSGNLSARVPGEELMVIKASGVSFDDLDADAMRRLRPRRRARRGRAVAVQRRRHPRLRLPRDARGRRRRAHPQRVRDGVGGARRGDPVRADRDGRRVRRARSRSARSR